MRNNIMPIEQKKTYDQRREKLKEIPGNDKGLARDAGNKLISREERMKKMIDEYTGYDTPVPQKKK